MHNTATIFPGVSCTFSNLSSTKNKNFKNKIREITKRDTRFNEVVCKHWGRHKEARVGFMNILALAGDNFLRLHQKPLPPHYKRAEELIIFTEWRWQRLFGSAFMRSLCKHQEMHVFTLLGLFLIWWFMVAVFVCWWTCGSLAEMINTKPFFFF